MNSVDYFTHLKDTSNQGDKYEGLAIAPLHAEYLKLIQEL